MKITAEFNSNEELLSFIGAFGAKGLTTLTAGTNNNLEQAKAESTTIKETTKQKVQETKKEPPKAGQAAETLKKETVKENKEPKVETPKDKPKENKEESKPEKETSITKEMIRAKFMELIKAGKSKEAKEITKKYGASKLPELKEEDYSAVYKEVEALL